jgi:hypothetical protein
MITQINISLRFWIVFFSMLHFNHFDANLLVTFKTFFSKIHKASFLLQIKFFLFENYKYLIYNSNFILNLLF